MESSPHQYALVELCLRGLCGVALLVLLPAARGWSWGCEGHQAVALIAEKHMTAHALESANKLLESAPIDPALSRYCQNQGLDLMEDSATWADDLRSSRPEASPWHYIDIPRDAPRSALASACPASTGCVTSAIQHQMQVLRDVRSDDRSRADALRFVIHLVGDLHQPLHCVTNNDMGGNCVPIDFFGNAPVEKNPQYESYSPNLHSIWDYAILVHVKGPEGVAPWAAGLDREFGSQVAAWQNQGINVDEWAWESHELADTIVYPKLPIPIPVEKPVVVRGCSDDNHVSTRLLKLHEQVLQPYVDATAPTMKEQIAKAGVRLAMILNQIWP